MVEHELLRNKLQGQLGRFDLTDEEQDCLVRELNELTCILIDACQAQKAGAKSSRTETLSLDSGVQDLR